MKQYPLKLSEGTSITLSLEYFSSKPRKQKLLEEKHFVAGGSARLMFDCTTAQATESLDLAIVTSSNIAAHLRGSVGDASSGTAYRLLARYYHEYDPVPDI